VQGLIDGLNAGVKSEDIVRIINVRLFPFFPVLYYTCIFKKFGFVMRVQFIHVWSHEDEILQNLCAKVCH
jgi:hypothetical protein